MLAFQLVGPQTLRAVDLPEPQSRDLGPGQVLVRLGVGGICGSDLATFRGYPPARGRWDQSSPPVVRTGQPLHEIAGRVLSSRDPAIDIGARVVGWASASNGLAEVVVTDGAGLCLVPDDMDLIDAIAAQPLACVLAAVARLTLDPPEHAAVLGLGSIGLLFGHVLHHRGAEVTGIDLVAKSGIGSALEVDHVVRQSAESWAAGLHMTERPQLVVEAVGHQARTLDAAVTAARPGGEILCFGIPDEDYYAFPMNSFLRKNLRMTAGITVERRQALEDAIDYLSAFDPLLDHYVTHSFQLKDAQKAFDRAVDPTPDQGKIVVTVA